MTEIIDTPESIKFAQMLSFRGRLQLELKGFRSSFPTLKAYNQIYETNFRTRKQALEDVEKRIEKALEERGEHV